MTQSPEQPPLPAAYYPTRAYFPDPPKNLTALGVLAFAAAGLATLFTVVNATVVGRATEHMDDQGDLASVDWSVPAYFVGSLLEVAALLAGWVAGSMWLYQARKNAQAINPTAHHNRGAGWAWGGWVCPIVSLWFPFQVVRDVRRAVAPHGVNTLIGWWWGLYLVMNLGSQITANIGSEGASDASAVQSVSVFFAVVTVVTLTLWGLVLRQVTREQHERMYGPRT